MYKPRAFISGEISPTAVPFSRFLPPWKMGVLPKLASEFAGPGSIVLDPFGTSPRMALELANEGYRVVVVNSNPVTRFLLHMLADVIQEQDLSAALAALAGSRVGEERLEIHLRELYTSKCESCGQPVEVDAFVWQKEPLLLIKKQFNCDHCGFNGEQDVSGEDINRVEVYARDKLTRARALSKIAPSTDPDRPTTEKALSQYLPRSLYALFTTINRFEALTLPQDRRNHIALLLLNALDQSNTMWGYPEALPRPRQLVTPPHFIERNLWKVLENTIAEWQNTAEAVEVFDLRSHSPSANTQPGVWLFPGRMKDFVEQGYDFEVDLIASIYPRPAPAFWTLSAMWGSWLWGKEILGGFRSVIRRQRFDWAWHTSAISNSLQELSASDIAVNVPCLGITYESETAFDLCVILSGQLAGYQLEALAFSADQQETQFVFKQSAESLPEVDFWAERKIAEAGSQFLKEFGMPVKFQRLHTAGLTGLTAQHLAINPEKDPSQQYYDLRDLLDASFSYRQGFSRYRGSEKSNNVGLWWLVDEQGVQEAVIDRMEQKLVNHLIRQVSLDTQEAHDFVRKQFPGLQKPSADWIDAVLESYAELDLEGRWVIKPSDQPDKRRSDLELIKGLLGHLGRQLGYQIVTGNPFIWMDEKEDLAFSFHMVASALIDKIVFNAHFEPDRSVIVLPGSRANLAAYKIKGNPRLEQKIKDGWHFLKFRRLRWIAENPTVMRSNFVELINQDPLSYTPPQERLL